MRSRIQAKLIYSTMTKRLLLLGLALGLGAQAMAQLSPGNPLIGLEKLKDFEAMRDSSSDKDWHNGNGDARPIPPGDTLVLAEMKGPGVIAHFWCTISHNVPFYSRLLTLRIYWDGEKNPSVECPIGDFFGIGNGVDKSFISIPIRVSSDGRARNCYWPMPFRKSARITVTNDSKEECRAFYYYLDWQKHAKLPRNTAYFHAMYRQEYPCAMGQNYLLADIEGRGHYVGTIQSVHAMSDGWYGEGDDFFFIDGEKEPSLRGTGTEDYFCDGWGFREQDGPFYGTPHWEGLNAGDRCTAYRFHLMDPVVFKKSLRVEIEHKGSQNFPDGKRNGYIERDDMMSSVALWYQVEPHRPWPALPAGSARLPFTETGLVVGRDVVKQAAHSPGAVEKANPRKSTGNQYFLFQPKEKEAWAEFRFTTPKEQRAELIVNVMQRPDGGKYRTSLDGQELGVVNGFAPDLQPAAQRFGTHTLPAGEHVLRLECTGHAAVSEGYALGLDSFVARAMVYTRPANFDLRSIQK